MGVQDRGVVYDSCAHTTSTHSRWSPSPPLTLTTTMADLHLHHHHHQQQHQQQHQQYGIDPPPPYPGHTKHVFSNRPGFRQSYSGSDTSTDMSMSSTENLSSWHRQDPQGEETTTSNTTHHHPHHDTTTTTLIHQYPAIHEDNTNTNTNTYSILTRLQAASPLPLLPLTDSSSGSIHSPSGSVERLSSSSPAYVSSSSFSSLSSGHCQSSSGTSSSSSSSGSGGGGDDLSGLAQLQGQRLIVTHPLQIAHGLPPPQSGRYFPRSVTPTYHHPHPYVNQDWTFSGEERGVSEKYGGAFPHHQPPPHVPSFVPYLPPPPEYPGHRKEGGRPCEGKVGQSRCLSDPVRSPEGGLTQQRDSGTHQNGHIGPCGSSDPVLSIFKPPGLCQIPSGSQVSTDQLVELLSEENSRLQEELVQCYRKIAKLQKLEQEIHQVQEAYQSLVRSTDKRERLEAAIKNKLQDEVKNLQCQNDGLRVQVLKAGSNKKQRSRSESRAGRPSDDSEVSLRQQLNEKHTRVEQLLSQVEQWEQKYSDLQAARHSEQNLTSSCCAHSCGADKPCWQELVQTLSEDMQTQREKHSQQLHHSHARVTQLESQVTQLQTQLAEKEEALKTLHHIPQISPQASSNTDTTSQPLDPSHQGTQDDGSLQKPCPQHWSNSQGKDEGSLQNSGPQPLPPSPTHGTQEIQLWQV